MKSNRGRERWLNHGGNILEGLLDLLSPPQCTVCGTDCLADTCTRWCSGCLAEINYIRPPLCPRCGKPAMSQSCLMNFLCEECLADPPAFDSARSLASYERPVSRLIQRLKFQGDTAAAAALVEAAAAAPPGLLPESDGFDLIVPVPLHKARLRSRGLNQSVVLTQHLFSGTRAKLELTSLVRRKDTIPQTGLSGAERRRNLRTAFALSAKSVVAGKHVCLVDDVYTTGATVRECADTLKKGGAASVHVLTFARV